MFNSVTLKLLNFTLSLISLSIYLQYITPFKGIFENFKESIEIYLLYIRYYYYLFLITISLYEYIYKNIELNDFINIITSSSFDAYLLPICVKNESFKEIPLSLLLFISGFFIHIKNKFFNNTSS